MQGKKATYKGEISEKNCACFTQKKTHEYKNLHMARNYAYIYL